MLEKTKKEFGLSASSSLRDSPPKKWAVFYAQYLRKEDKEEKCHSATLARRQTTTRVCKIAVRLPAAMRYAIHFQNATFF